ncbi:hypothetical protein BCR44DRAFT_159370 [Catenaria anguillulae PL171]|uniref:EamA domain-containing protein n=1 Tax=Catenaria anguillulae PL171 TaxID=765915 RepID=A0A1Y2HPI4_9FUNG|nr:hypothetical protein BCR44DRAFT_159370 [Catenaria anguillulae PL171]
MKEKGSDEFNSDLNSVAAAIKSSSVSRNEVLVDPFTGRPTLSRRSTAASSVALDLGTPNVSRQSSVASNLGAASEKGAPSSKLQEPSTAADSPPTFRGRIKAVVQAVNPGLVLMIINAVLGCFTTLFSKTLTGKPYNYQPFQLVFFRSLVVYCIGTLWQLLLEVLSRNAPSQSTAPRTRVSVLDLLLGPKGARWLLLGRASSGFVSVFTYYYSVRALSVGEATVLSFVSPIVVGILGALVLKERWEKIDAAASVISLFGVSVIANPSMLNFLTQSPVRTVRSIALAVQAVVEAEDAAARTMSFATGIVSAVAGATTYIWIRKIGKGASAMQVSTIFGLHSVWMSVLGAWAAGGSPWTVSHGVPASAGEWGYLLGLSCVGLTGQVLLNVALRFVAAAKASCMNFVQVPASFTLDFLLHGRVPSLSDCVGGGTIVSCVLMVALAKSKRADPLPNPPPPVADSYTKSVETTAAVSDRNAAEPGKDSFIESVPMQPQLSKQETSPPSGSIRSRTNSMARPKAVPARSVLGNADRLGLGNRAASGVSGMSRPIMRKADRSESQPLVGTLEREQQQQQQQAKSPKSGRGAGR